MLRMEIKLKKNLHHWLGNFDKRGCVAQEPRGAITAKRGSCAFGEVPSTHACPLAKCNAEGGRRLAVATDAAPVPVAALPAANILSSQACQR